MGRGDYPAALQAADAAIEALKSNPQSDTGEEDILSAALSMRAQLLLWLDRPGDALVALERSVEYRTSERSNSAGGDLAGRVRLANGDPEGALRAYDEALATWAERVPQAPAAFRSTLHLVAGKAETLLAMGQIEQARALVEPVWAALNEPGPHHWYERQRARLGLTLAQSLSPDDPQRGAILETCRAALEVTATNPDVDALRETLASLSAE